jgi:prepilin-type processing-associated H-X9-DG protein
LLVVIAIVGTLMGLLVPAVQRVRETANRIRCQSNLKQLGLALHLFHNDRGYLPPGVLTRLDVQDSYYTAFTDLLPYLEQDTVHRLYHYDKPWYDADNYTAVGQQVPLFYCPSNRGRGVINLSPVIQQWGAAMPPFVGSSDYVLCKGANGSLDGQPTEIPQAARGLFNVVQADYSDKFGWLPTPRWQVRLTDVSDGTSSTFAIGEGAGGNSYYQVADLNNPTRPVVEPFVGGPAVMDQGWGAASFGDPDHPWYAGILGVTAQYGLAPNPMDEPMNRRPGTPTVVGNGRIADRVSGFRSMHPHGCNFLYADGSVHFVTDTIDPAVYRALSTYSGDEVMPAPDF